MHTVTSIWVISGYLISDNFLIFLFFRYNTYPIHVNMCTASCCRVHMNFRKHISNRKTVLCTISRKQSHQSKTKSKYSVGNEPKETLPICTKIFSNHGQLFESLSLNHRGF